MQTVGIWTHGTWSQMSVRSPYTFNWVSDMPSLYPEVGFRYPELGGLAILGGDAWLNDRDPQTRREMPPEIIYNNGLHEAAHALFYAGHTTQGLMCISVDRFNANLREPGVFQSWDWKWRGPVSHVEHMVYMTYGNPMFKDGMRKSEVEDRLDVVIERKPAGGGNTLICFLMLLLFASVVAGVVIGWDNLYEVRAEIDKALDLLRDRGIGLPRLS